MTGIRVMLAILWRAQRRRVMVWVLATVGVLAFTALSVAQLYNTPEKIASYGQAVASDALIVPLTGHLEKRRPSVLIHEAVDPRSYGDAQSLLDRLAARLGEEILKAPDRVDPNLYWRAIWREDSAGYGEHLWRRRHPVRTFRRRVRGKLASVAGQVRQRPA